MVKRRRGSTTSSLSEEIDSAQGIDFSVVDERMNLNLESRNNINISGKENDHDEVSLKPLKSKTKKSFKKYRKLLEPSLKCSLCLDILFKPMTTFCGHNFCRLCLANNLKNHYKPTQSSSDEYVPSPYSFSCPFCRKNLDLLIIKRFIINYKFNQILEILFKRNRNKTKIKEEENNFKKCLNYIFSNTLKSKYNNIFNKDRKEKFNLAKNISCKRNIISFYNEFKESSNNLTLSLSEVNSKFTSFKVHLLKRDQYDDNSLIYLPLEPKLYSGFPVVFNKAANIEDEMKFDMSNLDMYLGDGEESDEDDGTYESVEDEENEDAEENENEEDENEEQNETQNVMMIDNEAEIDSENEIEEELEDEVLEAERIMMNKKKLRVKIKMFDDSGFRCNFDMIDQYSWYCSLPLTNESKVKSIKISLPCIPKMKAVMNFKSKRTRKKFEKQKIVDGLRFFKQCYGKFNQDSSSDYPWIAILKEVLDVNEYRWRSWTTSTFFPVNTITRAESNQNEVSAVEHDSDDDPFISNDEAIVVDSDEE